jgi:hypothetical protein
MNPFPPAELKGLYPTHDAYVTKGRENFCRARNNSGGLFDAVLPEGAIAVKS